MFTFAIACTLTPVFAVAQAPVVPPRSVVAYVSGQRVSTESNDGKAGQSRLQALRQERANELKIRQQALEATRQQLLAAKPDSQERRDLLDREQQQRTDLDRAAAQAQVDLQNLQRQVALDLQPKVRAIVEDLVRGTDIQVVLQLETAVIWAMPGLDLTSAVIQRMNARPAGAAGGEAGQ